MLPYLLNTPRDQSEWLRWGFHHQDSHDVIRGAILQKKKIDLNRYQLYPIFGEDLQGWLNRHAQTHIEMNAAIGLQGVDLLDVDFKDERQLEAWIWLEYLEHQQASIALGV